MTTARTHLRNVSRGTGATPLAGAARARVPAATPDDFTPVSAETFGEAVVEVGAEAVDPSKLDFDPADFNIDEVKQYVEENPETAGAILELELNGKERATLLSFLDSFTEG